MPKITKVDINKLHDFKMPGGGASDYFRPGLGEGRTSKSYRIRLLPPYEGLDGVPFHLESMHYFARGVQGGSGVAPDGFDLGSDLFFTLRELEVVKKNETVKKLLDKVKPTVRAYCNVIHRDVPLESQKVQIWSMSWTAFDGLRSKLDTTLTKDKLDITDPENGRDVDFDCLPQGAAHKFANFSLALESTPVGIDGWENQLFNLKDKARTKVYTEDEISEWVASSLGEFREPILGLYNAIKNKENIDKFVSELSGDSSLGTEI